MTDGRCLRCGDQLDGINITSFQDVEQQFIYIDCDCPQPCCPFCERPLDSHGKCVDLACFFVGNLAPQPLMRSIKVPR